MPNQREVVEVHFRLPDNGRLENHPVIIISNSSINNTERGFVAIMMTSEHDDEDEYSFEIKDSMFEKPIGKAVSAVRLHLIGNFMNTDIIPNSHSGNKMKEEVFRRLLVHINRITFKLTNFRLEES